MTDPIQLSQDLIFGAGEIAEVLGITTRQVYYIHQQEQMPFFRIGSTLCARRSTLMNWITETEQSSPAYRHSVAR